MNKTESSNISARDLDSYFHIESPTHSNMDLHLGSGAVQSYRIEEGLVIKVWNCSFNTNIQLTFSPYVGPEKKHYTLAYFQSTEGIELVTQFSVNSNSATWNILFFCTTSDHILNIKAFSSVRCITISFSEKWIIRATGDGLSASIIKNKICKSTHVYRISSMNGFDQEIVTKSVDGPLNELGEFSLKTSVYALVVNYFSTLKEEFYDKNKTDNILSSLTTFIINNVSKRTLDIQNFCKEMKVSLSTLKRYFYKQYGMSIQAFYHLNKMNYAKKLLDENYDITHVAAILGYKNIYKFKARYKKFNLRQ